jgi:hypothetical protein
MSFIFHQFSVTLADDKDDEMMREKERKKRINKQVRMEKAMKCY